MSYNVNGFHSCGHVSPRFLRMIVYFQLLKTCESNSGFKFYNFFCREHLQ